MILHFINPDHFAGALALAGLFVVAGVILTTLLKFTLRVIIEYDRQEHLDRLTVSFLGNLAAFFLWLLLAIAYAHVIPQLHKFSSALLAGAGIVSVVIGLAAQSTLGNIASGISLVLYKPFRKGDRIQVTAPTGLETGIVEEVTLGYTVLRTFDNRRIVMSNSKISSEAMINLTSVEPRVLMQLPISIGYTADIDHARAVLLDLAAGHEALDEVVGCPVTNLGASSVDLTLRAWCKDAGVAAQARVELLEQVKKRFDKEGIEIPYGYQNVILHGPTGDAAER